MQRICKAAGVPKVTAHGMRGLHSTLAVDTAITSHVVASSLGHESFTTTVESYAKREAVAGAQQRRVLAVLTEGSGIMTRLLNLETIRCPNRSQTALSIRMKKSEVLSWS